MDLAEWYSAGRWVGLLELIDMLPTACRLNEAIVNDPVEAARLAELPPPSDPYSPKVSEFDLPAIMQREALSYLATISQQLVGLAHGKPQTPKLFPGPRTEIDRVVEVIENKHVQDIAALFGFGPEDLGFA